MSLPMPHRRYVSMALHTPDLEKVLAFLNESGRADLAQILAPQAGGTPAHTAAFIAAARQYLLRFSNAEVTADSVVVPGEFPGERLVLAWVSVQPDSFVKELVASVNAAPPLANGDLMAERHRRGQYILVHYPLPFDILGGGQWVDNAHLNTIEVSLWAKDPDRPKRHRRYEFTISFAPGTADVTDIFLA